jgi:O-antigen/teichoic acid export membrane protein
MSLQALFHGVAERLPGLVLGRVGDASALALFSPARELADVASSELKTPIRAALFPGLARIAGDRANLRASLVEATGVLTLIALPLSLGVALTADDLVPLLLGERWLEIVPLLRVLACAGALLAFGTNSHLVLLALDQPHLVALTTGLRLLILLPLSLILIPAHGALGGAYALLIAAGCTLAGEYMMSSWRLGIHWTRFAAVVWRPLLAGLAMAVAVIGAQTRLPEAATIFGHALRLALLGALGAIVYAGAALALARLCGARDGAEQRVAAIVAAPFLRRQAANP